jgi:hypothetical protein
VGQAKALALAARDWRREARRTALRGLLDGTLAFAAPPTSDGGAATDAEPDWLTELAASGLGEEP